MTESERILRRQTEWQRSRHTAPWSEKIRQVERMRPSIEALRKERRRQRSPDTPGAARDGQPASR